MHKIISKHNGVQAGTRTERHLTTSLQNFSPGPTFYNQTIPIAAPALVVATYDTTKASIDAAQRDGSVQRSVIRISRTGSQAASRI